MSGKRGIRDPFADHLTCHGHLSFGSAGAIYLGPDAAIIEAAAAVVLAAGRQINERLAALADLVPQTPDGLAAKGAAILLFATSAHVGCVESVAADMVRL